MSGSGHTTSVIPSTGDARIDGILGYKGWGDDIVFYSLPDSVDEYGGSYAGNEHAGFFQASETMGSVVQSALDTDYGSVANDGFSVEGFTDLNLVYTTQDGAHIRVAQTTSDPYNYNTAWGYYPNSGQASGDVWLSSETYDYATPVTGTYAYLTMLHELGHTLGLEHAHTSGTNGTVPSDYDAMEYTVMSYRSYAGGGTGYSNETYGYIQSFMMLDIAALQQIYGADFTTNSGDTVYSWDSTSGITYVNAQTAISPEGNRIFATIWDGGGIDTYDLSAYATDLVIDLAPGGHSQFSTAQLANLGGGHIAKGNIYNALQYKGDVRSLIENAIGGAGNDTISGNKAMNALTGGQGHDTLYGLDGKDVLKGGNGKDLLKGAAKDDALFGGRGGDKLYGGAGEDTLNGGAGNDRLTGGSGKDWMSGGDGADRFRFIKVTDSGTGADSDVIRDFASGEDKVNLAALSDTLFTFDNAGFSGAGPSVTTSQQADDLFVQVDVDGDGLADMRIILEGVSGVTVDDFIL